MFRTQTHFNGSDNDVSDLTAAVTRYCACEYDEQERLVRRCGPHNMMLNDQRALDGLLYGRSIAVTLMREEGLG